MNLAVYEWRKLFRLPALWAFLALCLAFNGLLIATLSPYDRAFFNETSQTAKALGQRVDEDFLAGLDAIPATENRDLLRQSVTGMEDIFETYDTGELSDFYAGVVEKSPLAVTWMTWKYDLLASRVEHLAQTDAALDLYAGLATYGSHQFLFGALFRAILCESAILAMLGTLYLLGYEGMHRAEGLACASRTGRKLRRVKVLAALQASGGAVRPAGVLHPGALLPAVRLQRNLECQRVQPVQLFLGHAGGPALPHLGGLHGGSVPGRCPSPGRGADGGILPAGVGVRHAGAKPLSGGLGAVPGVLRRTGTGLRSGGAGLVGGLFDCLFPAGNGLALLQRLVHGAGTERRPPLAGDHRKRAEPAAFGRRSPVGSRLV